MKIFIGEVISTKTLKTATVAVGRVVTHPVYGKRVKKIKKYQVHNDQGALAGQNVKFVACKPYSKTKKWKIIEIIESVKSKKAKRTK